MRRPSALPVGMEALFGGMGSLVFLAPTCLALFGGMGSLVFLAPTCLAVMSVPAH